MGGGRGGAAGGGELVGVGGAVEVLFEAGNDVGPPEFLFGLAQFEFHLLVGIEEGVEQFVGGDAVEGAAGMLLLADEAEGFVIVGGGADEEGEDLVLLIGGEGELFGEFGEAFAGRGFGLAGLGEVLGGLVVSALAFGVLLPWLAAREV